MKVGDLIEYVDAKEYPRWLGMRGWVMGVDSVLASVRFFDEPKNRGFYRRRLKVITIDDLTGEECAMLMQKEMLGGGG